MSDHHWQDRLSEYVDGGLTAGERRELETHLAQCEECAATAEDLARVVARAQALEDRSPAQDLWMGIAERIGASTSGERSVVDLESRRRPRGSAAHGRRFSFSLTQLIAASVALVLLSAGSAWLALESVAGPSAAQAGATLPSGQPWFASSLDEKYGLAIAELQQALEENRAQLDPKTVETIEENLIKVNRAIADARRALMDDPSSAYLNEHLARTMQQKLQFLRGTTSMLAAS